MASFTTLPSGSIRAEVRRKGFEPQKKTFKTREDAQAWADATEANMLMRTVQVVAAGQKGEVTVQAVWDLYKASPVFAQKSQNTREREVDCSAAVLRLLGQTALANIDVPMLQTSFIDVRAREKNQRGKQVSGDTVRLEKALLSQLFSFGVKRGYCKANPLYGADLDMPGKNKREVRISPAQEDALCERAFEYTTQHKRTNKNLSPWLLYVFGTGSRPGESAKVECSWVHLDQMEVRIPRAGHKTRRPRIVIFTEGLRWVLSKQLERAKAVGSKYLFWSVSPETGECIPYRYYHPWRAICKLAGVPPEVVPHAARHEFISRLFENTTFSDGQIAALVGDVHVLSLEPYKHLRVNSLRDDMDKHRAEMEELREKARAELAAAEKQRQTESRMQKLLEEYDFGDYEEEDLPEHARGGRKPRDLKLVKG